MVQDFESIHKFGKENVDMALKNLGSLSKGMQSIASEVADYSKRNYESSSAALERVISANTLDKAFEAQAEFMRAAYDDYIDEVAKLGDMYASLARHTFQGIASPMGAAPMEAASPMGGATERGGGNVKPVEVVSGKERK